MKTLLITFTALFSLILGLPASSQATAPSVQQPKADLNNSLRFVAIDSRIGLDTVYMFIAKDHEYKKLSIRMGTPGERVPVPQGKRILFYKDIPAGAAINQPLLNLTLPENLPAKSVVLLGKLKGKIYALYVDEKSLRPGTALLKNMTSKPYLIDMPEAPGNEQKRFLLEPGKDYLFGSKAPVGEKDGQTYRALWRHEVTTKDGSKQWFVERKMMLKRYKRRALIVLIRPDDKGTTYVLNEVMLFLDPPRPTGAPRPGAPVPAGK